MHASPPIPNPVRPSSPWPGKILALLRANNPAAAIAQIRSKLSVLAGTASPV